MHDAQVTSLAEFISVVKQLSAETHEANDRPLYESYLSHAGVVLAKVIQGQEVRSVLRKCFIDEKSIQAIVDKHIGENG